MTVYRCNTCLGVYMDPQADGRAYAHVCAPVIARKVTDGIHSASYRKERDNKRDERQDVTGKILAEGAGRTQLINGED